MSTNDEFIRLWKEAKDQYIDTTNRSEAEQRVLERLENFTELDKKLQGDHKNFTEFRQRHNSLRRRIQYFTQPVNVLSDIASSAVGLTPFAPASTIFGALSFLIKAAEGVSAAYDWIEQLFHKLEDFTVRLNEYCKVDVSRPLANKAVKILVCLLDILAQSEKTVKTGRFKKYVGAVFRGEDKDIKALFDRLAELFDNEERIVLALNFATGQRLDKRTQEIQRVANDTFEAVKRTDSRLQKFQKSEEEAERLRLKEQQLRHRKEILKWISFKNFPALQDDILRRRQDGTGLWFLNNNSHFQPWLSTAKQTLFCPGMKGAGKTIIAATVIDYLSSLRTNDTGLAYVFYKYKPQTEWAENSTENMLSAILKQLLEGLIDIPESISQLYETLSQRDRRPGLDDIYEALKSACTRYSKVYVIVDALDECDRGFRVGLVTKLRELQASFDLRLLFTSRNIPEITRLFIDDLNLEVRASEHDIKVYVNHEIQIMSNCIQRDENLKKDILESVATASDGMFLIAQLHLDSLRPLKRASHVRLALDKMGSKTLDDTYAEAITRIDQQESYDKDLAWRALSWVFHAMRQLSTRELGHILSLEPETMCISDEDIYDMEDVVSVCAGLLTIDENAQVVRLIHYTTQEYFEGVHWEAHTELNIALDCVTYLSLCPFRSGSCSDETLFNQRLKENGFLEYAAEYWSEHIRSVEVEKSPQREIYLSFLCNHDLVDSTTQVAKTYYDRTEHIRVPSLFTCGRTGLHLTAMHGLFDLTKLLIDQYTQNGKDVDVQDGSGQTPLSVAARYGHEEIVKLLLATNRVNINSYDKVGAQAKTPLIHAAENGRLGIVNLLLDRKAQVEWAALYMEQGFLRFGALEATALSWAALEGHDAVVQRLLDPTNIVEVNPDSKDGGGMTPLAAAASGGHSAIVERLLKNDKVDPQSRNNYGGTPLHNAAFGGHEAVVELLLNAGVDPDPEDDDKVRPLLRAAWNGYAAIVQSLLKRNVTPDSKDAEGHTPLSRAAEEGYDEIVQSLLSTGLVNPDSVDQEGLTPLWKAAENGQEDVVKLLLDLQLINNNQVNPDFQDRNGRTILWQAANNGETGIVELFLDQGLIDTGKLNLDAMDGTGATPLWQAANSGHQEIVRLLLDSRFVDVGKVDPDAKNNEKRSPLWQAALNRQEEIVKLLLDARLLDTSKVDPDSVDEDGETPLWRAAYEGYEEIVRLLLDTKKVNPNSICNGMTVLWVAVEEGNESIVELLLGTGKVDPNWPDENGDTPLSTARSLKLDRITKMLEKYLED